jgi:hypothetical protein
LASEIGDYVRYREELLSAEQYPALTNRDRGLVNYRLAKCYQALLEYGPDQPDVQELLNGTIQSALVYLEGEPEQAWALRLLDQVESDT